MTKELDQQQVDELFAEIEQLINAVDCTDPNDWAFTGYGHKACGLASGYLAYPKSIDTDYFFDLIKLHREAQKGFNERWGIISDCEVLDPPTDIVCQNNKAVLVYN